MFETLLNIIYPAKCILCRSVILEREERYFCPMCYQKFRSEIGIYRMFKYYLPETMFQDVQLEEEMPEIMGVFPLFPYNNEYRRTIIRWKYEGIRKYAEGFAQLIVDEIHFFDVIDADALIPVPLSPSRLRKRGFNQACDLAEVLSKKTGISVLDCLERSKNTKPQTACTKNERAKNIAGCIRCKLDKEKVSDSINNIVIIDDIYTTGSTIYECCKALKEFYIFKDVKIYVLVIGSGKF